ncbi:MAG TPA: hypothetical protein VMV47_09445 [Bacteroidales bacterium]|nr:hypothetical protein [Bacteroidales bacterium]
MKRIIKSIWLIFNLKAIIIVIVAMILTYLCIVYKIKADFSLTLIGIAIVFPVVFSIGEAYKRRESALAYYANLKAHGRSIFLASRDWVDNMKPEQTEELRLLLKDILLTARELFQGERDSSERLENQIYKKFSDLSRKLKEFRSYGLTPGEMSRVNQYQSKMMDAFENMKHIYQYRTPRSLRAYGQIFTYLVPIVYAPYFAYVAHDSLNVLSFIMPVLFTLVLVGLDNIQDHLENPFDLIGEDDVKINAEQFAERLKII